MTGKHEITVIVSSKQQHDIEDQKRLVYIFDNI